MSIYKVGRPTKFVPATKKGTRPPHKPGEYRICDSDGNKLYIGEACDLYRRMREHVRSGKISEGCSFEFKIADGRSTSFSRREHERLKIQQHKPPLNQSRGGEGRPASRQRNT